MTLRILRFLLVLLAPIAWRWFKQRRTDRHATQPAWTPPTAGTEARPDPVGLAV